MSAVYNKFVRCASFTSIPLRFCLERAICMHADRSQCSNGMNRMADPFRMFAYLSEIHAGNSFMICLSLCCDERSCLLPDILEHPWQIDWIILIMDSVFEDICSTIFTCSPMHIHVRTYVVIMRHRLETSIQLMSNQLQINQKSSKFRPNGGMSSSIWFVFGPVWIKVY